MLQSAGQRFAPRQANLQQEIPKALPDRSLDLSKHTVLSYQQTVQPALDTALRPENTAFVQTNRRQGVFHLMRAKDEQV